jgi:Spy/CpxP family protein refolding chaperone
MGGDIMRIAAALALSLIALAALPAHARFGGFGRMGMASGVGRCGRMLMRAHPDVLKSKLGLSDKQLQQIQPLRQQVASKSITLGAQMAQLGLQLRTAMEADLPDQNKVIDLSRKLRNVKGQLVEERIKAGLKLLQILTKEQRAQLRAQCAGGGGFGGGKWGRGWRRGGHGGFGGGGGGGHHGAGWGPVEGGDDL